ncbi:rRNA biogenesis protein rrp5 [Clostridium butyricum]|uniref:rRNA biogenesis protein rrp5 n=1 Tax=Clostridium butyricum TaxID=1492 RepID=UPI00374EBCC4
MSKVKLLVNVIQDLKSLAEDLEAVVNAMNENEEEKPTKKAEHPESNSGNKEAKVKKIKLEDVRAVLAEKSQAGMVAGVREIIKKYGASKLSEIDPKNYADVIKDAEELKNE